MRAVYIVKWKGVVLFEGYSVDKRDEFLRSVRKKGHDNSGFEVLIEYRKV